MLGTSVADAYAKSAAKRCAGVEGVPIAIGEAIVVEDDPATDGVATSPPKAGKRKVRMGRVNKADTVQRPLKIRNLGGKADKDAGKADKDG